jgi:hypothetical protein
MRIKKVSPRGLIFYLQTICDDRDKTDIYLADTGRKITVDMIIERLSVSWYEWQVKGKKLQEAFPYLVADEREFLMSGLTSEEWDKIFPPEKHAEE